MQTESKIIRAYLRNAKIGKRLVELMVDNCGLLHIAYISCANTTVAGSALSNHQEVTSEPCDLK